MSQSNKNKKKNAGGWFLPALTVLLIVLLNAALSGVRSNSSPALLIPIAAFAIVLVVLKTVFTAKQKKSAPAQPAAPSKPAVRMNAAFPQPEAHCVVCENTGDDHFAHDREQRIKQLDEWLKNGIIDRKEYQVLKARYERDQ